MIEVFCTNVQCHEVANKILDLIGEKLPGYKVNFDLEDCDKILRVESPDNLETATIMDLVISYGYSIWILEHNIHPC
ncbi:hypothetical protein ACFSKL_03695 [Belliella marina]|uniref:HMA domain-containing protein n=1 Tax=Belliella marina TaxID=1644146 RepID=A0ABW4VJ67_9BACT